MDEFALQINVCSDEVAKVLVIGRYFQGKYLILEVSVKHTENTCTSTLSLPVNITARFQLYNYYKEFTLRMESVQPYCY